MVQPKRARGSLLATCLHHHNHPFPIPASFPLLILLLHTRLAHSHPHPSSPSGLCEGAANGSRSSPHRTPPPPHMGSSHLALSSCTLISRAHSSLHTHGICKPLGTGLRPHSVLLTHTHPFPPSNPALARSSCTPTCTPTRATQACKGAANRSLRAPESIPCIHTRLSPTRPSLYNAFARSPSLHTQPKHNLPQCAKGCVPPPPHPLLSSSFSRTCTPALTRLPSTRTSPCTLSPLHTHLGDLHTHPNVQGGRHGAASAPTPTLTPLFHACSLLHARSCTPTLAHPLLLAHPPTQPKSAREL